MIQFVSFLLTKVYKPKPIPNDIIISAFEQTVKDVNYHFPKLEIEDINKLVKSNSNELAIFLFRLGRELHIKKLEEYKNQIHWLLKELCSCEIYFNNDIDEGFYIVHGQCIVIGSRNSIGKGFKIHQGCTIGHKKNGEGSGMVIGNNVTLYCNSSIVGDVRIGDNVIIGAHTLISEDIKENTFIISKQNIETKQL